MIRRSVAGSFLKDAQNFVKQIYIFEKIIQTYRFTFTNYTNMNKTTKKISHDSACT